MSEATQSYLELESEGRQTNPGFQSVLNYIRERATSEYRKGELFERLMVTYFSQDPDYQQQFSEQSDFQARNVCNPVNHRNHINHSSDSGPYSQQRMRQDSQCPQNSCPLSQSAIQRKKWKMLHFSPNYFFQQRIATRETPRKPTPPVDSQPKRPQKCQFKNVIKT